MLYVTIYKLTIFPITENSVAKRKREGGRENEPLALHGKQEHKKSTKKSIGREYVCSC